jgi:Domain of unknown function (DUF4136)
MKLRITLAALACAAFALSATLARGDDVKTDYNHQTNFSNYHTYSWGTVQMSDQIAAERVKHAVDDTLQKKGWQEVPSGGQVTIMVKGQIRNQEELQTFYDGLGGGWGRGWRWGGWGWGPGGGFGESTTTATNIPTGHLVIDVFDTQNKDLVWRGISTAELSNDPEKNRKKLYQDVDKMFKKFPPK